MNISYFDTHQTQAYSVLYNAGTPWLESRKWIFPSWMHSTGLCYKDFYSSFEYQFGQMGCHFTNESSNLVFLRTSLWDDLKTENKLLWCVKNIGQACASRVLILILSNLDKKLFAFFWPSLVLTYCCNWTQVCVQWFINKTQATYTSLKGSILDCLVKLTLLNIFGFPWPSL